MLVSKSPLRSKEQAEFAPLWKMLHIAFRFSIIVAMAWILTRVMLEMARTNKDWWIDLEIRLTMVSSDKDKASRHTCVMLHATALRPSRPLEG